MIAQEVGMPFTLSNLIQVGLPVMSFATAAQLATDFPFEEEMGNSLIVREPVGVVGAITPWNYPLHQIAAKVAPALAAGCTVVLKPSEVAPLNAFILAEILDEVGLPPGRVQPRHRRRPRRGRGHRLAPARRHGVVHRIDPGRQAGHGSWPPRASSGWPWSSGASRPTSSSRTPTSPPPSPPAWPPCYMNSGPDLLGADPHDRPPVAPGRGRGAGGEDGARPTRPGDPFDADTRLGPARLGHPARAGAGLHPQGRRRRGHAAHRRGRAPRRARQGLLRASHGLLQRDRAT